nr:RNA polymerase factor sigma-54 [Desulfobacterales bacterium]
MALEVRQQLRITQQLVMTPQLQQAIKILQLSRLELIDMITQELQENPVLEEETEEVKETNPVRELVKEVTIEEKVPDDIDWSNYLDEYNTPGPISYINEEQEAPRFETFLTRRETLAEHLKWQLLLSFDTLREKEIGTLIIGNLNEDGYLQATIEEIAATSGYTVDEVKEVLSKMQTFDPPGICARDLKECLLIQANLLNLGDSIVVQIIKDHLKHLENKNYKAIAQSLGISVSEVLSAVEIITRMEPKPGRPFAENEPIYISPDVFIHKVDKEFVITLNDDGMPRLRVSSLYRDAVVKDKFSPETREYIQEKLRSAVWLIRSIHQRQRTIYNVVESIVRFQREFLEKGIAYLKPMVLRDVAEDVGMHESTISRATTNKYVHTPQGIFELKYFFNSPINRFHGDAIASASVKEKIREIIQNEDPHKPYSDKKIASLLRQNNIDIARRTVAKYREMLGVLPSNKRKKIKEA